MTKKHVDPEYERWRSKYPKFPGFGKCVELLRSPNVHGAWIDIICYELKLHAHQNSAELIATTRTEIERDSGVVGILLNIVADSQLSEALPFFSELLQSPNEALRPYAINGLKQLDTKDARRLLWENGEA